MVEKEFICMKEASQMLGINERTMKKILINNDNELHSTKVGGKILINKKRLLQYIDESRIIRC